MVIASGSPGHLHVYWRLHERASTAMIESTNRRLALGLHGEPGCADIVRMLRPPESLNHKHTPPAPVRLLEHDASARYALADVLTRLPHDPQPHHERPAWSASPRVGRTALDRELLAIPAADYVRVLTGREPNRAGKVLCPFHEETGRACSSTRTAPSTASAHAAKRAAPSSTSRRCCGASAPANATSSNCAAASRALSGLRTRRRGVPVSSRSTALARLPGQLAVPFCLLAAMLLAGCAPPNETEWPSVDRPPSRCVEHDGLPDPRCTPGAIRAGALATICAFGYAPAAVRPPESFTGR